MLASRRPAAPFASFRSTMSKPAVNQPIKNLRRACSDSPLPRAQEEQRHLLGTAGHWLGRLSRRRDCPPYRVLADATFPAKLNCGLNSLDRQPRGEKRGLFSLRPDELHLWARRD